MRNNFFPLLFFILTVLLPACGQESTSTLEHNPNDSTEQQTFFPVTEYIRGQLRETDSMPITPIKIITQNGKADSFWMKKEDIRIFAQPFLHPEIDSVNFKDLFIQKSFLDQTINSYTFSYDPAGKLPDSLQLRRWDVYIDATKNTIERIYIVKENHGNAQILQLTWKSNKWCKITTLTEKEGKQPEIREEIMKWDFSE